MASGHITSWEIDGEIVEIVLDFIFLGSKITAHGDCSHEIKRCLLLGRKVMTNLDSILKSRYTMEYYSAIEKNTFKSVLMRWMKLEPIIQSKVSQKEKHQYRKMVMITLYARQQKRHRCKEQTFGLWEKARVGRFERTALKYVYYHM